MEDSKVLSRLLPVAEGDEQMSVYEGFRRDLLLAEDLESQTVRASDMHNDDDSDDPEALLYDPRGNNKSIPASPEDSRRRRADDDDDDVPESLLLAGQDVPPVTRRAPPSVAADTRIRNMDAWRSMQEQHGMYNDSHQPGNRPSSRTPRRNVTAPPPQRDAQADAMWLYTNANNLDSFLKEVYEYYTGHGVWSISLERMLSLATELFVFAFAMFLTTCIDYSKIPSSKRTSEVLIPKCMAKASWLKNALTFFFIIYWLSRLARHVGDTRRLFRMHDFFRHGLDINDQDIQTVSWVRVVDGLVKMQNANIATADQHPSARKYLDAAGYSQRQQRLNAETIANRLMRQDNYYVAMYNKEILDFTLPLPFFGNRQFYSKSLEYFIEFSLTNFIFDERGGIRSFALDMKNRSVLVEALRKRLFRVGLVSIIAAPFFISRFCILFFFRYYTEFTRNPSSVSARTFTPFAEWKIRQFNELDHLFQRRLRQAYPFANDYLKQFPKDKMDQACRFIAFVSGAFAAVLAIATLLDPELFLGFEITPGRNTVFWLTVTVGIFGVAHGALPDETEIHDPVLHLRDVLQYTNYIPAHWKDRLHTNEVRNEFSAMYQPKVLIFVEEVLSLIVTPWILMRNATHRSERIIDFFRDTTVHVEGIGNQCNFAVFNFKKDPNAVDPSMVLNEPDGLRDDYYGLKDDKLAASMQNFMQYYSHYHQRPGHRRPPGWQPPPAWPPMLSSAIAEESLPAKSRPAPTAHFAASRRSGYLDRQHGPISSAPRSPGRNGLGRERRRASVRTEVPQVKTFTDSIAVAPSVSESVLMRQDSDLHDYIEAPQGDRRNSDTEQDEGGAKASPAEDNGVLGMLYQFSKAQAGSKGPGVQI